MCEKTPFRLNKKVLIMIAISLAVILAGCTVPCNTPALIDAINNANANPAHSTLDLTTDCVYTLTAVDNSALVYGDNGLPMINTPITINGHGATITRLDSAPPFRFFFITDPGTLTINDLTLSNGYAEKPGNTLQSTGGAIYNRGQTLEVNSSTLEDNQASFYGGAIFNINNATTYVIDSIIRRNEAPRGGGIFVYHGGLLSISGSEISDNEGSVQGGGISLEHGAELSVVGSTITSNHSGRRGGGIFKDSGADSLPTSIDSTTFRDNSADWSGGGIFVWNTPLSITESVFEDNHALEYGGGLAYQDEGNNTVSLSGVDFNANSAGWNGGAIHFSGDLMTVSGGTIEQNNAENGAGIHNGFATVTRYIIRTDSELILTSCFVQENQASEAGGGAFNEGIMTCGEANFINNQSATLGGGIHSTGELDSNGCLFEKNSTGFDGGGICSYGTSVIRGSEFTYNTSTRGAGLASVGGNANISGSTFLENTALESGGGIFNMGSALGTTIMNIVNTELEKNQAMYGGGVASSVGDTRLVESTLSGNTASKNGGGVYNGGIMSVEEILFNGNEASDVGGGIFNFEEVNVLDSTFKGNQATGDGGGFNNTGTATLTGSTFVDNRAANGGGLASPGGDTALTNDTFSGNAASGMGGGIYVGTPEGSSLSGQTLASFITVAYNNAADGGGVATGEGAISIKNSIVAMNVSGGDCSTASGFSAIAENIESDGSCSGFSIKDDPLLDVLANYGGPTDTHALQAGSPAIDEAPDCTVISGGAVFVDQRGIARPGGLLCDLGAYEDESGLPAEKQDPCTFTAIVNLNCRLGPDDTLYPIIDSFKEGESALVVGQSWDKVFAYVEGPINKEICAVPATSKFGVLEGECEDVPVMEAPEIDETYDAEEPTGCTVYGQSGELICMVPCPKDAKPGTPCTP